MVARVVEKVPLDAPHFLEHLPPLRPRLNPDLERIELERTLAHFRHLVGAADEPARTCFPQHFLTLRGEVKFIDPLEDFFRLARLEIEALQGGLAATLAATIHHLRTFEYIEDTFLTRGKLTVIFFRQRQRDDPLAEAFEVDHDLDRLFVFFLRRFGDGLGSGFFRGVVGRFLGGGDFRIAVGLLVFAFRVVLFLVAFRCQRRGQIFGQHGEIDRTRHRMRV